jgi:hypothetical protein
MRALAFGRWLIGCLLLFAAAATVAASGPSLSFSATPASIAAGGQSQLNWAATNARRCSASGAWSGARETVGAANVGPLNATSTFTLRCWGQGGSITQNVTVSIGTAPAPTVTLTAAPAGIAPGGSSTLTWSSAGVTKCTAGAGWSGSKPTSGSASVGPLTQDTTYSLSCSGVNGSAVAMTSVAVRIARISWTPPTRYADGSKLTPAGYRIYYGTAPTSYSQSVTINNASTTQWELSLPAGTWYFAATALDAAGKESAYSNEAKKTIN